MLELRLLVRARSPASDQPNTAPGRAAHGLDALRAVDCVSRADTDWAVGRAANLQQPALPPRNVRLIAHVREHVLRGTADEPEMPAVKRSELPKLSRRERAKATNWRVVKAAYSPFLLLLAPVRAALVVARWRSLS